MMKTHTQGEKKKWDKQLNLNNSTLWGFFASIFISNKEKHHK